MNTLTKPKKTKEQIENENWSKPKKEPNQEVAKKLFGIALERLILVSMKNHIYQFDNVTRLQMKGAATGLDETGEVADVYMLWWDNEFLSILKQVNIEIDIYARFKDDINEVCDELNERKDIIEDIWKLDSMRHKNKPKLDANFTANVMCELANGIDPMISFTVDTCEKNPDNKLPMLDVKVYLDNNQQLIHEYFEKSTKNRRVILASSALSWAQKRTIHTQECIRIMKNTSVVLGEKVQNEYLSTYMKKLMHSGYNAKFRGEIVKSAKSAYKKFLNLHKEGKNMYRNRSEMEECKLLKQRDKEHWWQNNVNGKKTLYFYFVRPPHPQRGASKNTEEKRVRIK